jgi:hypothetical protein
MPPLPDLTELLCEWGHVYARQEGSSAEVEAKMYGAIKDYAQAVADERVRDALAGLRDEIAEFDHKLVSWANAYPEDVFPKPDLAAVRAALEAAGLSLDCVSAHSMRHVASKLSESFGVVRSMAISTPSLERSDPK